MCFDTEPCEVCKVDDRRARKPHRCDDCQRTIEPREMYRHFHGIFDGKAFSHKQCRRCGYDTFRVVQHELEEGCDPWESDPGIGGLSSALENMEMQRTPVDQVPVTFPT